MTATPIPRTIALTAYTDLDLSILDEMPPGRQTIKTWVVPPHKRLDAYHWIEKEIKKHHSQAFIVCPLIESSDKETMKDIKSVTQEFNNLNQIFNHLKLDLLHGRLKSKDKQRIITDFQKNKTHILVATPVIEVGIDIPNATIMVIEDAERFGLAQLHQLRGRVGRRDKPSYCLLFTEHKKPAIIKRLKHLETTTAGLKLAEIDLKLRGPGDLYGLKQHGFLDLKLASFTDVKLLKTTQQAARKTIKNPTSLLMKQLKQRKIHPIAPN
jgi:ATP-dependent DNA helicase RecG